MSHANRITKNNFKELAEFIGADKVHRALSTRAAQHEEILEDADDDSPSLVSQLLEDDHKLSALGPIDDGDRKDGDSLLEQLLHEESPMVCNKITLFADCLPPSNLLSL